MSSVMPPDLAYGHPVEPFVDPQTAADYLRASRKHVLEMVRKGIIPGHAIDPNSRKKDWRFLLSELREYMLKSAKRPPGAREL
jgi:excisionase family DNA binding protein